MILKAGAKFEGLKPELVFGLLIVHSVFNGYGIELVVTEVTGGQHMHESLHYCGLAVDIRSKHIENQSVKQALLFECRKALGKHFDMILEAQGQDNEHFHFEVDYK